MDSATPTSEDHQQQQQYQPLSGEESDTAATIPPGTPSATTSPLSSEEPSVVSAYTFFDPTKNPPSSVFLGGIDIAPTFLRLQFESAEIVNDLSKSINIQLLPLFL